MLYDCGNGAATVVDHMRKLTCYLSEQQNDIWHGKVLRVDRAKQIADVYFFIEKYQEPHKFIRETFGRAARNSVLAIAEGHWISTNCWQEKV